MKLANYFVSRSRHRAERVTKKNPAPADVCWSGILEVPADELRAQLKAYNREYALHLAKTERFLRSTRALADRAAGAFKAYAKVMVEKAQELADNAKNGYNFQYRSENGVPSCPDGRTEIPCLPGLE